MRVTISCAGRFHAFDLAVQLNRFEILEQLITSYPKFEAHKYGIPRNRISSLVYWEVMNRGWARLARYTGLNRVKLQYALSELFDKSAAPLISSGSDIYIGWSGTSERGLKRAKTLGAQTILERGSAHIETQTALLTEEYYQYGNREKVLFTHPGVIEKELREYELADFISVPSSFAKSTFVEKGIPERKIIKNPYGTDINRFKPGVKEDNIFRVIYVGQMSFQKGVHYLLEAFDSLKLKNAELLLIGGMTKEMEPYFARFKHCFKYLGIKPQSELNQYYIQSSVFIMCSVQDGMGMVIVQAMASGLPVICTTNTAGEDVVENGKEGFVIPIRDVESIMKKLLWMYEHQDEAKCMGIAARSKVLNGFSWNDYGNRYVAFLNSILNT